MRQPCAQLDPHDEGQFAAAMKVKVTLLPSMGRGSMLQYAVICDIELHCVRYAGGKGGWLCDGGGLGGKKGGGGDKVIVPVPAPAPTVKPRLPMLPLIK